MVNEQVSEGVTSLAAEHYQAYLSGSNVLCGLILTCVYFVESNAGHSKETKQKLTSGYPQKVLQL